MSLATVSLSPKSSSSSSYKVYTALLTQSGTSAPVATILENTLGFVPNWLYDDVGWYKSNNSGFTDKTVIFLGQSTTSSNLTTSAIAFESARTPSSGGSVVIQSRSNGTRTNELLNNTSIEIRVYN